MHADAKQFGSRSPGEQHQSDCEDHWKQTGDRRDPPGLQAARDSSHRVPFHTSPLRR